MLKQKTIRAEKSYSGIGIHGGKEVRLRFCPAKENEGIFFRRIDLPTKPIIPASLTSVFDTSRSTNIANGDAKILTVEHVLAAVKAFDIDNLCIELSAGEPPAGNGSSDVFVELLEEAGSLLQKAEKKRYQLKEPVAFSDGDVHLVAVPSDEYRMSYTLHYPQAQQIGTQYYSFVLTQENFKKEIAVSRTFALYEEISHLIDRGLIKGASLDNAVVIKEDAILSKGGLFFPNEMARHKILDLIGDLALIGIDFTAHIIAIRSGHTANFRFAQKLYRQFFQEELV